MRDCFEKAFETLPIYTFQLSTDEFLVDPTNEKKSEEVFLSRR